MTYSSPGQESQSDTGGKPIADKRRKEVHTTAPPEHLIVVGFYGALTIAVICLLMGAFYLYRFMESANSGIEQLLDKATGPALRTSPQGKDSGSPNQGAADPKQISQSGFSESRDVGHLTAGHLEI